MAGLTPAELETRLDALALPGRRMLVAIAGAPGSGKSTLAETLAARLDQPGRRVAAMPMDGFHYDDAVLNAAGIRAEKGAPHTFDFDGFKAMLERLKTGGRDVAIPVFHRRTETAHNAARIIAADTALIIIEGNYLLLGEDPWRNLKPLFDVTVFAEVSEAELGRRLTQRWLGFGFSPEDAQARAFGHDMDNGRRIIAHRLEPDLIVVNV